MWARGPVNELTLWKPLIYKGFLLALADGVVSCFFYCYYFFILPLVLFLFYAISNESHLRIKQLIWVEAIPHATEFLGDVGCQTAEVSCSCVLLLFLCALTVSPCRIRVKIKSEWRQIMLCIYIWLLTVNTEYNWRCLGSCPESSIQNHTIEPSIETAKSIACCQNLIP